MDCEPHFELPEKTDTPQKTSSGEERGDRDGDSAEATLVMRVAKGG